ncbi:MAG TPA: DUF2917 domain-containing protein [Paucimonas sp.]|nr:DUF2917 domain-containing protein [Paucimonas sp.]HJW54372.1 DUF2917 domain-containing protein [Burkholderiaceae bacterium]
MRNLFTKSMLTIGAGQAMSGISRHKQTMQVISGSLWVTVESEPYDYWLSAGDIFTAPPDRLIVAEADGEDCRIAHTRPSIRHAWPNWRKLPGHAMRFLAQRMAHGRFTRASRQLHATAVDTDKCACTVS